jgi:hypothetical protein
MEEENSNDKKSNLPADYKLIKGEDYYLDELGRYVFTSEYLLKRGYCCESGCRHCPYGFESNSGHKKSP